MEHSALSIFPKDAANRRKVFLFRLPECSLSYVKITQGECNSKVGKLSFHNFDTAEPKLILCKDNISDLHSQKYESKNEPLPCRYTTVDVTP